MFLTCSENNLEHSRTIFQRQNVLTGKQHQLLSYLIDYQAEDITPSFDEMRAAIGLASKSGIHGLVCIGRTRLYPQTAKQGSRIEILRHQEAGQS